MQNEEKNEVFRGHLDECVKSLAQNIYRRTAKGTRRVVKEKEPIAVFCGTTVASVTRWLNSEGRRLPTGDTRIKLICFLDLMGYRVIEWLKLPPGQRGFAELIGFGLVRAPEAGELLGYDKASRIYDVLNGNCGAGKKTQKMWEEWKKRKEELERKKTELRTQFVLESFETIPMEQVRVPKAKHGNVIGIAKELIHLSARIATLSSELLEEGVE